ncbi:MAG TPA: DUF4386 family protein [Aggregatilineales bacterium]|nr:DUF4386 family protein [Aggregatilineales bacterium]
MNSKTLSRTIAFILILEGLLMFAPTIILGMAIGWPGSLGDSADVMLHAIFAEADATRVGYLFYLLYSILFLPTIVLIVRMAGDKQTNTIFVQMAISFASLSTLARVIGIIRWLVAMPELAVTYNDATVSTMTKESIIVTYNMLNNFGGSIGEILGVSIFASLAIVMVAVIIFQNKGLPRWTGYFAISAAIALCLPILEIMGVNPAILPDFILIISVAVVQFWFLFLGAYLFFRRTPSTALSA